jgi:hypothetical protein
VTRKKIEIHPGSIAPVQRTLWSAALEKLEEAMIGLQQMISATDRVEFERGWNKAVDSLAQCSSVFYHEGKSTFPEFES